MENSPSPMVSVIMAVYNGGAFIEMAIVSVLSQSYRNLELLIVNDGSTDNSEEVIFRYLHADPRVRYFKQENRGVAAARNVGLAEMKGSYFAFLDADDMYTADSVASRMLKFEKNDELTFCDGGVAVYDSLLQVVRRYWRPTFTGNAFKKLIRLSDTCFFGPTWLIKREVAGPFLFDESMTHAEDLCFFLQISKEGVYDFTDGCILKYRRSEKSAMRNLEGLAEGYRRFYAIVRSRYKRDLTFADNVYLFFKIRKIMILSFLSERCFVNAFLFLLTGKVK